MDCSKSHNRCKAECCSCTVPIPEDVWLRNQEHLQRQPQEIIRDEDGVNDKLQTETHIVTITDGPCVFLKDDLSCAIYDDRPWLCRKFGDESCAWMTCTFQSKDGRIRSRQERRKIEREHEKATHLLENKLRMFESVYRK